MKMTLRMGFLCLLLLVLTGCPTMNELLVSRNRMEPPYGWVSPRGTLVSDDTNSGNIELGHLDTNVNYYYSDSPTLPAAVIKVSKDYAMDGVHWKPITDPEMLIEVVQAIKVLDGTDGAQNFRSFTVKGPDTRPIGTWYSNQYVYGMKLRVSPNKQVSLYVPNFINTHSYYAKKGGGQLLSQGMPTSPELQSSN